MKAIEDIKSTVNSILVIIDGLKDELELTQEERNHDYEKIVEKSRKIIKLTSVVEKQLDIAKECL